MTLPDNKIVHVLIWLLPSIGEVIAYFFVALLMIPIANINAFQTFLYIPSGFSLRDITLTPLTNLLSGLIGERPASLLSVGIFWALVGMLLYVVLWLFSNFSTELTNDLKIAGYKYPKGADNKSELRLFLERNLFRAFVFIFFLVYLNIFSGLYAPKWMTSYRELFSHWPDLDYVTAALFSIAATVGASHVFTILTRLILLRKRVF